MSGEICGRLPRTDGAGDGNRTRRDLLLDQRIAFFRRAKCDERANSRVRGRCVATHGNGWACDTGSLGAALLLLALNTAHNAGWLIFVTAPAVASRTQRALSASVAKK